MENQEAPNNLPVGQLTVFGNIGSIFSLKNVRTNNDIQATSDINFNNLRTPNNTHLLIYLSVKPDVYRVLHCGRLFDGKNGTVNYHRVRTFWA